MDDTLVRHCSPTLLRVKTGNLISLNFDESISQLNNELATCGIEMKIMRLKSDRVLVYIYRRDMLEKILFDEDNKYFLIGLGYTTQVDDCLDKLSEKFANGYFPHEIGLFLDYPLEDVVGYMVDKGKNCLYSGTWQVYSDVDGAKKKQSLYQKATEKVRSLYGKGFSLKEISELKQGVYI